MNYLMCFFVAAIALLLPSCVRWHIGAAIRDAADRRVGVDVTQPLDGKTYELPKEDRKEPRSYYTRAPEVRYRLKPLPLVEFDDAPSEPPHAREAVDLCPTGRALLIRYEYEGEPLRGLEQKFYGALPLIRPCYREEVQKLPKEARLSRRSKRALPRHLFVESALTQPWHTVASLGTREYERCWPATFAAAPFDYAIDPVLSGVSTAVFWTGAVAAAPFIYLTMTVDDLRRQWRVRARRRALPPVRELLPAHPEGRVHPISERPKR